VHGFLGGNFYGEESSQKEKEALQKVSEQFSFYSNWYNAAIREIIALKDAKHTPQWISRKINPPVTPQQVKVAISLLRELGFIRKDAQGRLVQDVPKLDVDPDEYIQSVKEFTRSMIELGWESIERFDPKNREVSGLTLAMSPECYEKVKEMIRKTQDDIFDYVCKDPGSSELVCRVNMEMFPLVSKLERKKQLLL